MRRFSKKILPGRNVGNAFRVAGILVAIVLVIPITEFFGYFAWLYATSAFPSHSLAVERFEEGGLYRFPKGAADLYFRMAVPSPLDRGGSAMRFSAGEDELSEMLNILPAGLEWKVLEQDFYCDCMQCICYVEPVKVPAGSSYWRSDIGSVDYKLLALNVQTRQVFLCGLDT